MKQKMFTILDEVFIFLEKYPVLRDNDERLMANIWNKYLGDITVLKAKDILRMLSKGELHVMNLYQDVGVNYKKNFLNLEEISGLQDMVKLKKM